ncbi:hypothetical protein GGS26DRAFT_236128 [Hypomontagnella submonticulosa]|nr:hypothetical protein GGS26DRAFT_236128 [Hypomontagnella submonticulosa]
MLQLQALISFCGLDPFPILATTNPVSKRHTDCYHWLVNHALSSSIEAEKVMLATVSLCTCNIHELDITLDDDDLSLLAFLHNYL